MPRLKKNVAPLLDRATDSLTLAIELFNRPSETGRNHGVLILLQHSFEMLLKAMILQSTGSIHTKEGKYTYSFDKCLSVASEQLKLLSSDEKVTLSILDAQRDQAAHYYIDISEDLLYVHAQSGVTLFDTLLQKGFSKRLADFLPSRVLPISTRPPKDLSLLLNSELEGVDRLLAAGRRQGAQASAKLRTILAFSSGAMQENGNRISESEINSAIEKRRKKKDWNVILPEIAQLTLSTDGTGIPISMKITKEATISFKIAKPGDEIQGTLVKQEVDPWTVFNLGLKDLAKKLDLTRSKTLALIYEMDIQSNPEYYRELKRSSQIFKSYSKKALDRLREGIKTADIDAIWARQRPRLTGQKNNKSQPDSLKKQDRSLP